MAVQGGGAPILTAPLSLWIARRHKHQVGSFVRPKPETVTAVNEWLSDNGLNATVLSPHRDWIGFKTTVSHANVLFDAEFSTFVHDGSGKSVIRALAYSIPASLKDHLQLVHPTITCVIFPLPSKGFLTPFVVSQPQMTLGRPPVHIWSAQTKRLKLHPHCAT
jgi:tripeptidyl-peptidase-1